MGTDHQMQAFAAKTEEVLDRQATVPETGLSAKEIRKRRKRFGRNELKQATGKSAFSILLHQVKSVIIWLLAAGAAFSLWLGDLPEAAAIIVVLIINTAIGFSQNCARKNQCRPCAGSRASGRGCVGMVLRKRWMPGTWCRVILF